MGASGPTRPAGRRPAAGSRWACRSGPTPARPGWSSATPAATINPFNGEGIAYAYESGRLAADAVHLALDERRRPGPADLPASASSADYGLYYKVARAFVRIIGRPELMRVLVTTGMRSRSLMEWVLRIMANLLRPDELGPAEAAYRAVAALARLVPEAA